MFEIQKFVLDDATTIEIRDFVNSGDVFRSSKVIKSVKLIVPIGNLA